jgi:formyltetrahydrofolate-dependent phosphoribosylglycinamide formyltransferase
MKLAVLLSGSGRTLENLIVRDFPIKVVISSRPDVRGCAIAQNAGIPLHVLPKDKNIPERNSYWVVRFLEKYSVDLVCMAGWLRQITVPQEYASRIINIHPSLLPSFGGKGFYGNHVHEAVLKRGCKVTGCTVHFVDDNYDHGPIILQKTVPVLEGDDVSSLSARVFSAECDALPEAICLYRDGRLTVKEQRVIVS